MVRSELEGMKEGREMLKRLLLGVLDVLAVGRGERAEMLTICGE